jgi:heterotetrameric sarcosine oxidase gamma subunit
VASLIEKTAFDGLLPVTAGGVTLTGRDVGPVTSVAPFKGAEAKTAAALKAMGLGWPAANRAIVKGGRACLWTGRGQAFLVGTVPKGFDGIAALTDQSDGWAVMTLSGLCAADALARLVPVDLRLPVFAVGNVARTGLNHMMCILHRTGADAFDIFVFRSMAATAVHELHEAMRSVGARASA